jgi:hypothetical protein
MRSPSITTKQPILRACANMFSGQQAPAPGELAQLVHEEPQTSGGTRSHMLQITFRNAQLVETRAALELLVELGTLALDGDVSDLRSVLPALGLAVARLHSLHEALRGRALCAATPFRSLLAEQAEHRRRSDLRELDALSSAVSKAQDAVEVGRSLVIASLVLLANLDSDERWYSSLSLFEQVAAAA